MRYWLMTLVLLLLFGCGDQSTGPEGPPLTPSVLSLEFTGDSSKSAGRGNCQITVDWTACQESSFESYTLYRSAEAGISPGGGVSVLGTWNDPAETGFVDDDVLWGQTYHYALLTSGVDVDSVWSNEDSLRTPGSAPTASVLSWTADEESISLDWTGCPDADFQSYTLYRSDFPDIQGDTSSVLVLQTFTTAGDTAFVDTQVVSGNLYYYVVKTENDKGFVSWSNEVSAQTSEFLPTVQNLQLGAGSGGCTVELLWSPVGLEITGYWIYFRETAEDPWTGIGTAVDTAFVHEATSSGEYSVKAYSGNMFSEDFAEPVSTMPNVIEVTYTLYDNWCAPATHSAIIFGPQYAETGFAASASFPQDMYLYDDSRGDQDVWLYSGNYGVFGNGNQTYFQEPQGGIYGCCDPDGPWYDSSYELYTSDRVVFLELPYASGNSAYVKMYGLEIQSVAGTTNGTSVSFRYEYQPNEYGFTLFTTASEY